MAESYHEWGSDDVAKTIMGSIDEATSDVPKLRAKLNDLKFRRFVWRFSAVAMLVFAAIIGILKIFVKWASASL